MDLNEFKYYYLNLLLEKLAKEKKTVFLLRDFNVDLLKYEHHKATNKFLDPSNMVLPYIIQPTRITSYSKSIIDNIFFQLYLSGNNIRQPNINHIRSLTTVSYSTPHFFKCSQQKVQHL